MKSIPNDADPRQAERRRNLLVQETLEMQQRARLGGFFYPVLALVVLLTAGLDGLSPLALAMPAVFLVLAALRLAPISDAPGETVALRHLWRLWAIVLATSATWGGFSAWGSMSLPAPVPFICLLCSGAFGMALAHTMCMRRLPAALCIAFVTVPNLVLLLRAPGIGLAVVWSVYMLYMFMVMSRSHREYRERIELEEELRHQRDLFERQSRIDELTGLANRREFAEVLERRVGQAAHGAGLLILDVDHFKRINDTLGHAAGDACLAALASRLRQYFAAPGDLCARLGGEEFGVVFEGCPGDASMRAERFRHELERLPLAFEGASRTVTVSIGGGVFDPSRHADADALYREVDQALYRAKVDGRNRTQWTGAGMPAAMRKDMHAVTG